MRLDQLNGISAFLKVAETKSFSRAAAELGVAPPSLSEAIKSLESRLGVRLLSRTTRSVGLTEAGAAYLAQVRPAMEEIWAAGAAARETSGQVAGILRLNVPWIAGPLLIEPLMALFLDAHPDVKLDVVFDDGFVDLAVGGFDAGVRLGQLLEKDMIAIRVGGPLQMAVFASPAYLSANGKPKNPDDLRLHSCIAYRFASNRAVSAWEFIIEGRAVSYAPDARLSFNAMVPMLEASARGIGLVYTSEKLAASHVSRGALVKVLEAFCPTLDPLYIYYPSRRLTPPKLSAFVEIARRHI